MLKQLEVLILSFCEFLVKDYLIQKIAVSLNKLKHLEISNCSYVSDKSLHFISKFLTNLEYLDISWCRKLTDYGFSKSLSVENLLKYESSYDRHTSFGYCKCSVCSRMLTNGIHPSACSIFNDEEIDKIELEDDISLKFLKKLKTLKLQNCTNVTDLGITHGLNLSQLLELDIKLCTNISGLLVNKKEHLNLKVFNLSQVKFLIIFNT